MTAFTIDTLLLVNSGTRDFDMREDVLTRKDLRTIRDNTNAMLDVDPISFFLDHTAQQADKLGFLAEGTKLRTATITEEMLPRPSLAQTLLGKFGLFGELTITSTQAVQDYLNGAMKQVSVGLNVGFQSPMPSDARILEISAVGIGAIQGAELLHANRGVHYLQTPEDLYGAGKLSADEGTLKEKRKYKVVFSYG